MLSFLGQSFIMRSFWAEEDNLQKRASRWHAELRSTSRKLLYNF
jgi:hypothetical protein